jgi:hypothetical protein
MAGGIIALGPQVLAKERLSRGHAEHPICTLYRVVDGSPDRNLDKVIEMMGGIEKLIGLDDVVLIKPNAQWYNQGCPNLGALKRLVELIMERPGGFQGEVIVAENCHRGLRPALNPESAWSHNFDRNADIPGVKNLGQLCTLLKATYGRRFTLYHWIDVKSGGRRVFRPGDGDGYVYCDGTGGIPLIQCENGADGSHHRVTIMTYPIFTTDRGTVVDYRRGIWEKESYTGRPLRLINVSGVNHHSIYCGVTGSVKNYLGVSDLSGGPDPNEDGRLTQQHFNFHSFPFTKWGPGPKPGMLGVEVGMFLNTIRKADVNITTAEWVGLSSRVAPPIAHTRAVLASKDPVALDYHASKYVLFTNSGLSIHNPDDNNSPVRQYLARCAEIAGGFLDEERVDVETFDFTTGSLKRNGDLTITGERKWGSVRNLMKYLMLRVH